MRKHVTRAILLNDRGEALLGKRVRTGEIGKWGIIGGKLDEGETVEECVIREVREEVGVDFKPIFLETLEDIRSPDDDFEWDLHLFYGTYSGELRPKADEMSEITFVSKDTMDGLEYAYNHRELLRKFFETIPV